MPQPRPHEDDLAVDLEELGTHFGYAPASLLARSPWFRQGEALFAGGFVPTPSLVKMNSRPRRRAAATWGSAAMSPMR